ncbi:hypothetical protein AU184_12715 [Mycolicibacterium novocastrense]|uniref:Uncharacterized protein n=1 Tax=Mycolicibacterium novocastrense TaxID=59813 RepID=A0AAW5SFX7_MYCNV|nr:hypothetical protein [Mycolicibacterium novocastrense]KUH72404.1 hypothetical protein AU183_15625 [Mycolicibacterium novocastrense]KUH72845.1 hypothetical protein AU072_20075 [Mycolicibacterium novocastrense]KUH77023.1 hypothetical protein AU184_12715 [Mycolicibacterium novocastrense]MCV7023129.1 hypothetical protein [Mycolicibacterium novocastrense]GAT10777.1 uncharacterized protein RMCN_3910 [Mycolicibacterium novocastrense]
MSTIVRVGLLELAFGAMLGWVVAGNFIAPQLLRRAGVNHARRILQAHLDYVIMGIILIAVGLAVPQLPAWIAAVVIYGTLMNPTLFIPLAFNEGLKANAIYRVVTVSSFLATSVGLTLVAFQ